MAKEFRVNERIRAHKVRVVDDETGEQLGIMTSDEALDIAREKGMDLVEVAARSEPPVCKIMDFGRYKYQEKKKSQAAGKQRAGKLKEVKLRPKTSGHDYGVKLDRAKRFLGEGNKVKITMMFRGREIYHANVGRDRLMAMANEVGEEQLGVIEVEPRLEGRNMHLILAPKSAG